MSADVSNLWKMTAFKCPCNASWRYFKGMIAKACGRMRAVSMPCDIFRGWWTDLFYFILFQSGALRYADALDDCRAIVDFLISILLGFISRNGLLATTTNAKLRMNAHIWMLGMLGRITRNTIDTSFASSIRYRNSSSESTRTYCCNPWMHQIKLSAIEAFGNDARAAIPWARSMTKWRPARCIYW